MLGARWQVGVLRRYRRMLVASAVTLGISATLLGLIGFTRWRGRQAVQRDTSSIIAQTSQQLIRTLQSRRGTLTFLRDTLNRQPNLTASQLEAMGASAVDHTRHLLDIGLVTVSQPVAWWTAPKQLSPAELAQVGRAVTDRTRLRGVWRVPSTFVVTTTANRPILIMFEPLKTPALERNAVVGVFDLARLLEDFFATALSERHPVRLLDGEHALYRSPQWQPSAQAPPPLIVTIPVSVDAARWLLEMQPGATPVVQTLSWLNVLLIVLSVVAGLGITVIVWILAARTWILQRAVDRRTAALRRASQRLRQMAITDELTGLYNRRFFMSRWEWECERAKRYQRPLACLMIDVNGFKQVNDRLGHYAGDLVLQHVAQELKTMLRQSDILARFGGDEFIIALPETGEAQATLVAEKLRQLAIRVGGPKGHGLPPVTLSVGMGRVDDAHGSAQDVLEAADRSLYTYKRQRNLPLAR